MATALILGVAAGVTVGMLAVGAVLDTEVQAEPTAAAEFEERGGWREGLHTLTVLQHVSGLCFVLARTPSGVALVTADPGVCR